MNPSTVLSVSPLSTPWRGADPFLFMAHHLDLYPQGDGEPAPRTERLHDRAAKTATPGGPWSGESSLHEGGFTAT